MIRPKTTLSSHGHRLYCLLTFLDKFVDKRKKISILDVGGTEISEEAIGVKFPNARITVLNRRVKAARTMVVGDAQNMPFGSGLFDLIICIELIEHVYQPQHLIQEIKRVGCQDSLMLLTTPNMNAWYNRILVPLGFMPANYTVVPFRQYGSLFPRKTDCTTGQDHCRVFNLRALCQLNQAAGLRILETFGVNYHGSGHRFGALRKYVTYLMTKNWRENIGIIARNCSNSLNFSKRG